MKSIRPKTFYFDHGENAVILLHSYTGTPNDMRLLARRLEDFDYSVYAPMFAGHGTSNPQNIIDEGHPDVWWQQTIEAIQFMQQQDKRKIAIFGLSLGSVFATKALENFSDELVCGGVFGSPMFNDDYTNVHNGFVTYSQKVKEHYDGEANSDFLELMRTESAVALNEIEQTTKEVIDELQQIKKPFFIGQGSADELVNPNGAKELNQILTNNHVETSFHWYEDAGHVLTVNSAHHQLEEDVIQFLNQQMNNN